MARIIYTDEAGTSADQPICVVASVIVEDGKQKEELEQALKSLIQERVPEDLRGIRHLHTTDIFNGKRGHRRSWDRIGFLKELLSLPLSLDVPIAYGAANKNEFTKRYQLAITTSGGQKLYNDKFNHLHAFGLCMSSSDLFIRKYLDGQDSATVIAENVSGMQGVIKELGLSVRNIKGGITIPGQLAGRLPFQKLLNEKPADIIYRIDHIIGSPAFVPKGSEPILFIADACAFALRRFLSKLSLGDELVAAMMTPEAFISFKDAPEFAGVHTSALFNTFAYFNEEHWEEARRIGRAYYFANNAET